MTDAHSLLDHPLWSRRLTDELHVLTIYLALPARLCQVPGAGRNQVSGRKWSSWMFSEGWSLPCSPSDCIDSPTTHTHTHPMYNRALVPTGIHTTRTRSQHSQTRTHCWRSCSSSESGTWKTKTSSLSIINSPHISYHFITSFMSHTIRNTTRNEPCHKEWVYISKKINKKSPCSSFPPE